MSPLGVSVDFIWLIQGSIIMYKSQRESSRSTIGFMFVGHFDYCNSKPVTDKSIVGTLADFFVLV